MIDIIRQQAEQELGRPISDEEWTPERRAAWKLWLHGRNYSFTTYSYLEKLKGIS